ncbi:hypothetical protein A5750_09015 [Mycobacterium sp. 852002-51613_SCH5001154]|uniref:putative alpha/beta hydrolase n=1 Tax=Mycobacterium sp. 852002-51613_SCH5001154 TaxID=1834104 RepID=UPI0008018E66|nr:DUF4185 domain-containing protein [Mycobacterium sp. 852002-51613_SCH5001154]OBF76383.1 hypothetical protein A5750_09015 [Mycobacterium sp. 852002-51613_SCH5001154]
MTLTHLSEPELIASGGGDPWAINQSLQAGSPFQISRLAEAFHAAGRHTAEADHAFQIAQKRFAESWNHQNGDNPINDSAEVQRVTKSLGAQSEQLPKIGADLENIAAALADAQKQGAAEIATLDHQLQFLDKLYGAAQADLRDPSLPPKEVAKLHMIMDAAHADAVDDVRDAVKQMNSIRNAYSDTLHKALGSLHTEGYDPPANIDDTLEQPLRGEVRDLGPVAGTGAVPGIPGIGAADLGEIVEVPGQPGKFLAIFGDSFSGNKVGEGDHYRSVAVPVTFDADGRPHFGAPLTGAKDSGHELFPIPNEAAGVTDTLPAGTITAGGKTYMMVTGTKGDLQPVASWLVEVNGDPGKGWTMVPNSLRAAGDAPSQVSGYKGSDGKVYIAADSFDRSRGVTMYRADPDKVWDRGSWQPWTGKDWGTPVDRPVQVTNDRYGELSFREIGGKPVLSGFNVDAHGGSVEVRIGSSPTGIFSPDVNPTMVVQNGDRTAANYMHQPYGGYILPGSTLDNLRMFVSEWNTSKGPDHQPVGAPYDTREFQLNLHQ